MIALVDAIKVPVDAIRVAVDGARVAVDMACIFFVVARVVSTSKSQLCRISFDLV